MRPAAARQLCFDNTVFGAHGLDDLTAAELMALGENLSREKTLFLLRLEKPLECLSEAWMERRAVDEGELFQSLLIEVYEDEHQQLLNEPLML